MLIEAKRKLYAAGVEDARRSAAWLLEEALGLSRIDVVSGPRKQVSRAEEERFQEMVNRRVRREPVQYILGHTDFYGIRLRVTPDVLIPRPETEVLVEYALRRLRNPNSLSQIPDQGREPKVCKAEQARCGKPWVLDVGTGSGAIALAIKKERPDATVFASDVSRSALDVARDNAETLSLDVSFVEADALSPSFVDGIPSRFDLLISNPPYVPEAERATLSPEVRDHEPVQALFVSDRDPLIFYRALLGHAGHVLQPGGVLLVEAHMDLAGDVENLFAGGGLERVEIVPDLSGRPRIVVGVLDDSEESR